MSQGKKGRNQGNISGNDFHDSADILIIEARRNVRTKSVPTYIRLPFFSTEVGSGGSRAMRNRWGSTIH